MVFRWLISQLFEDQSITTGAALFEVFVFIIIALLLLSVGVLMVGWNLIGLSSEFPAEFCKIDIWFRPGMAKPWPASPFFVARDTLLRQGADWEIRRRSSNISCAIDL